MNSNLPFRTGRANSQAVLRGDGTLYVMAPGPESAEFVCNFLNAQMKSGEFSESMDPVKYANMSLVKMGLIEDGRELFKSEKQLRIYNIGVSRTIDALLGQNLIHVDPAHPPDLSLSEKDVENAAVDILHKCVKKKNFMDGLESLVKLLLSIQKKGRFVWNDQRELDAKELLAKTWCQACDESGYAPDGGPCVSCEGTGLVDPSGDIIRERYKRMKK